MDFHSLPRRELQALCKKNKIPANVTNAAMADNLKSLAIVEGIDELLQTCNSEMAQLSIEPRVRMEAASPFLPPTGGRSIRRRNPPKEETSRRSTRNANESQVDAFETPVASQTNRKKGKAASACRKMDSLLKECADEKKDVVLTPAPWGVTNQGRRDVKEDSAVKQNEGPRRSARLAAKSAKLLKGQGIVNPDFSKKYLLTEDCYELNLDGLDEITVVTDVSASTNLNECSAEKDEQVDSAKEQDVATDVETVVDAVNIGEENHEEKIQAEIVPFEKQVVSTAKKDEQVLPAEEQDMATGVETIVDTVTVVAENKEKEIQSEVVQCEKQVGSTVEEVDPVPSYEGESDSDVETFVDAVTIGEENHEEKIQPEFVPCEKQVLSTAKKDEQVHPAEEQDIFTGVETVVDAVTVVAEHPGKIIQSEVVQCEKQVVSTVEEEEQVPSYEGESNSETDDANAELKASIGVNFEQVAFGPKIAAEFDDQNCAVASNNTNIDMAPNLNNGTQETDGCDVIETSMTNIGGAPECEEADVCEDDFTFSESDDDVEEELELNTDMHNPDDSVTSEPMEESTKSNDSLAGIPSDPSLISDEDDTVNLDVIVEIEEKILVKDERLESPETVLEDIAADEPVENDETADQVFLGASSYLTDAPLSEEAPTQQLAGVENEAVHQLPPSSVTLDSPLVIPPVSTQIRASASKESKKRVITAASKNKENINSGSKTRHVKERSKLLVKEIAETQMDDQTMLQLSYDVTTKLEISQKLDKNIDGGNEVPARPALQEIQKNQ